MDFILLKLLGFGAVLIRTSVFLSIVPIFGSQTVPVRIRAAAAILVSVSLSIAIPSVIPTAGLSFLGMTVLIINEALYGLGLGLIAVLLFSAVKMGGQMIEREMGLAMAEMLDPLSGETAEPLSILMEMIFILLFLAANGHHLLLLVISRSYEHFPAGQIPSYALLTEGIVQAGSTMLLAGLRLAAPMLAAFMLLLGVLAVFARMIPEMDILFISMPLRTGLGLLIAGMMFPFIHSFIGELTDWMGKLLPL
ncbi:MAG: flagellar biosynthetic protein FliR [Phycisphaerae bacterium]|nr:flagellar biosynthetic protein FliR [Phycisphaerae bacterium]